MADENPLVGFHFSVDLSGTIAGYFTECSGLGSEHEVIEHKVVDAKGKERVQKIPGRLKWENITLKRGITSAMDFWKWRAEIEKGNVNSNRKNGSIVMYDQEGKPVAQWDFEAAWPSKVTGPQPKSDSNEVGVEEVVIAHEYIKRVK